MHYFNTHQERVCVPNNTTVAVMSLPSKKEKHVFRVLRVHTHIVLTQDAQMHDNV
jgi:hypothetical protein